MTDEELDNLAMEFQDRYGEYRGWEFDFEYPGVFVYARPVGSYWVNVYFTPDWDGERELASYMDVQGMQPGPTAEDVYEGTLTPATLLEFVTPVLVASEAYDEEDLRTLVGPPYEGTEGTPRRSRKSWNPKGKRRKR